MDQTQAMQLLKTLLDDEGSDDADADVMSVTPVISIAENEGLLDTILVDQINFHNDQLEICLFPELPTAADTTRDTFEFVSDTDSDNDFDPPYVPSSEESVLISETDDETENELKESASCNRQKESHTEASTRKSNLQDSENKGDTEAQDVTGKGSCEKRTVQTEEKNKENQHSAESADKEQTQSNGGRNRGRKRSRNEAEWKANVRTRRRQHGLEYINCRGKKQPQKGVRTIKDCQGKCRFKCAKKFSQDKRSEIFDGFWKLSDSEKSFFYGKTTQRLSSRSSLTNVKSRKSFSIKYFLYLDDDPVRVCKDFYLSTLNISQRRVSYYHDTLPADGIPKPDKRGCHKKRFTPDDVKDQVREHIKSFPKMPSHYARADTQKEFLEPGLTVSKMYRLYTEQCSDKSLTPVKEHIYRQVFDYEFNLGFHVPKKDKCDLCEQYRMADKSKTLTEKLTSDYNAHFESKVQTKFERDNDRTVVSDNAVVICFDLQNVIACPRANVSCFFYKRKLNVYNLTAHASVSPSGYCCVWHEGVAGRGGNEIASAVIAILERFVQDHPDIHHVVLWSDSCVPQNRNSIMTTALKEFLARSDLKTIQQKFCEPGHSSIQEVDNLHSKIEKAMKVKEIYSPLSFIRLLQHVGKKPLIIIQMKPTMFFDYQSVSKGFRYDDIPFSKVKMIRISDEKPRECCYKLGFKSPKITKILRNKSRNPHQQLYLPSPSVIKQCLPLSKEKIKDLKSMLKFMPPDDKAYMATVFKDH